MMQIEDVNRAGFAVKNVVLNHLLFLAVGIEVLCEVGKHEKAMRWLSFIQGALWHMGYPIMDMKHMNRPTKSA